jgi:hypothetical protein
MRIWRNVVIGSTWVLGGLLTCAGSEEKPKYQIRVSVSEDPAPVVEQVQEEVAPVQEVEVTKELVDDLDWEKIDQMMYGSAKDYLVSGNRFYIRADSSKAAMWIAKVCEEALKTAGRYLFASTGRGRTIEVILSPYDKEGTPPAFQVTLMGGGHVRLVIPWNDSVNRRSVMQGIMQAILVSEFAAEYGAQAVSELRPWLEMALTIALEVYFTPPMIDEYQAQVDTLQWIPLSELFSARLPLEDSASVAQNAYWFLRWLERQPISVATKKNLIAQLSLGKSPSEALAQVFPAAWSVEPGLECWWANRLQETVTFQNAPYLSLERSRDIFRRLAVIHFPLDSEVKVMPLPEWSGWVLYEPARAAIKAGLEELRGMVMMSHPVYRNAFLSLGQIMEFCLNDFKTEQDLLRWKELLGTMEQDFRDAWLLDQNIQETLAAQVATEQSKE